MERRVGFAHRNFHTMAPRLLSLLSLIETALGQNEAPCVAKGRPGRSVNFHKGLARMTFNDGSGSIFLQGFILADGEICIKALLEWVGAARPGQQAIYPKGDSFNWAGAACRIAEAWLDGPPAVEIAATSAGLPAAAPSLANPGLASEDSLRNDPLAAVG